MNPGQHADGPAGGGAGAELALVIAGALYCGYGVLQGAVAVILDSPRYPSAAPSIGLAVAVFTAVAAVTAACLRKRRMLPGPVGALTVVLVAAVIVDAALTRPRDGQSWVYFMYPVSLICSITIGLAYWRLAVVLSMTAALVIAYCAAAVLLHRDPAGNVFLNALSYPANTGVAWAVAQYLRRTGRRLDEARAESVAHATAVAAAQAHARGMRILHDRALQTLEALAGDARIADAQVRGHIAHDAAWLRSYLERDGTEPAGDLLTALQELAQRKGATGLIVELNVAQLREAAVELPAESTSALVDAAHEALTNVSKHAGVTHASVRARVAVDRVELTVTDRGSGFDPAAPRPGLGISESIVGRLAEIGGTATIDSTPGTGTVVRLTVPVSGRGTTAVM